ncbi:hypothetical protein HYPDE_37713 [Hyphomicrobium denitrificans 1NES1]|uniref:Uncharacterized protein n=1 Tax=Hyphomicrobium denitrificans 1NES1 TaxID=670307 RepID=N0B6J3_9HYPH|nr:hypothetical protein HYPDE_37713 [Hyphomicrobium denitrificans 1NES1]
MHSDLICVIPLVATVVSIRGEIQARGMAEIANKPSEAATAFAMCSPLRLPHWSPESLSRSFNRAAS